MHTTVDPNTVLLSTLASFRGPIADARIAYPEVLHVEVVDEQDRLWRFSTQDASWSPGDPEELHGQTIVETTVDAATGELRCKLSDGSALTVKPAPWESDDDPSNWELFTPDGFLLEYGPGMRWRYGDAGGLD